MGKEVEILESASFTEVEVTEGENKTKSWLLKLITPGAGSKYYYPADVLKRDGPKAFPSGTQMFIDHQTASEAKERPEGSLTRLAAVLKRDAEWRDEGPKGPGLYAPIHAFESHRTFIRERFEHQALGASIRAFVRPTNEIREGKQVIESMPRGISVDFVTRAGAGGALVAAESAGSRQKENTVEITDQEYQRLKGVETEFATLKASNESLKTANESLTQRLNTVQTQTNEAMASAALASALAESKLPAVNQSRVKRMLVNYVPVTKEGAFDAATFKARVDQEITQEKEDLKALGVTESNTGGQVRNMGNGQQTQNTGGGTDSPWAKTSEADADKKLIEMYMRAGHSEETAKRIVAAIG